MKNVMTKALCVITILSLASGIAACGTMKKAADAVSPEITVYAEEEDMDDGKIVVNGKSTIKVVPDRVEVNLGVMSQASTVAEAQAQNTATMDMVLAKLTELGVPDDSIRTTSYNVYPNYDWNNYKDEIIGYSVDATLTISDRTVDEVGALLSECVNAGANEIRGLTFSYSGYDATYLEALKAAVGEAHTKAEALAAAAGRTLGEPEIITEGYQNTVVRYSGMDKAMAEDEEYASAAVAVMPGQVDIEANVTVTYEMN